MNYILEKKDNTKAEIGWVTVTSTLRHCKYNVLKLIEGKEYLFRVKAENRVGPGPPATSKPVVAKDPFSKAYTVLSMCIFSKWQYARDFQTRAS